MAMLLKHRTPQIDTAPIYLRGGFEHLEKSWVELLRWLNALRLDHVVVGPVAHAIRGDVSARGPVAIVPAPYGRNFDRLASALVAQHAGLRSDRGLSHPVRSGGSTVPVKLTAEKLARGRRWMLRFGDYDLDIEGSGKRGGGRAWSRTAEGSPHAPRYQELLYEAARFQLAAGLAVEVASPEDLEHFSHVRRTGSAPEFRVMRATPSDRTPEGSEPGSDEDAKRPESGSDEDASRPEAQTDSSADA